MAFANTSGDQLRILRPEIDDQDGTRRPVGFAAQ
jgi:hypothetical protein